MNLKMIKVCIQENLEGGKGKGKCCNYTSNLKNKRNSKSHSVTEEIAQWLLCFD